MSHRAARIEARDMFAAYKRVTRPKRAIGFEEAPAVFILFRRHTVEDRASRGIATQTPA